MRPPPPGAGSGRSDRVAPARLARALEASWDARTAYRGITQAGNPAFGQCYPTARVVQWFHPEYDVAKGEVWTGTRVEQHFWNVRGADAQVLDLSWQQFPAGSVVRDFVLLDRTAFGDSAATVARCALLLERVLAQLAQSQG